MAMFAGGYFPNMVYEKKDWELKSFTVDSGVQTAKEKTTSALDAVDPNLAPFRSARRKADSFFTGGTMPRLGTISTVNYYEEVLGKLGQSDTDSFVRLYIGTGMQHCAGGPGADVFGDIGNLASGSAAQRADCAGNVGGEGNGAGGDHRFENSEYGSAQRGHDDQASMPVSTIGAIQGQRRPRTCGELCVRGREEVDSRVFRCQKTGYLAGFYLKMAGCKRPDISYAHEL